MEISRHWRIRKVRYSLQGGSCPNCESKMFPMRSVCPSCGYGSSLTTHAVGHQEAGIPVALAVHATHQHIAAD
jgi:uncharacterized OB-fold protein